MSLKVNLGLVASHKGKSCRPCQPFSARLPKPSRFHLEVDWDAEIEKGREAYLNRGEDSWSDNVFAACRIGEKVAKRWGRSCGTDETELLALAVKEVLGDRLGISVATHRDGKLGKNHLRVCRTPKEVAKELALLTVKPNRKDPLSWKHTYSSSPFQIWRQTCLFVARQYGATQATIEDEYNFYLYRGVTGSVKDLVLKRSPFCTRTLESWTIDWDQAAYFASRNGKGLILEQNIPRERILATFHSSDVVNTSELEFLVINPDGKFYPDQVKIESTSSTKGNNDHMEEWLTEDELGEMYGDDEGKKGKSIWEIWDKIWKEDDPISEEIFNAYIENNPTSWDDII